MKHFFAWLVGLALLAACVAPPPLGSAVPGTQPVTTPAGVLASPTAAPTPPAAPTLAPPIETPPPAGLATPTRAVTLTPSASANWSGMAITLSPDSGAPGTQVTIRGTVPGGPGAAQAAQDESVQHANLCWGGCLEGITQDGAPVQWSAVQPGRFTMTLTVPSTAWLSAGGPAPLEPGQYAVGVQCPGPEITGCALRPAEASTNFRLLGPAQGANAGRCRGSNPCAELQFSPATAAPGDLVRVQGWAPLASIGGTGAGYSLVLEQAAAGGPPPELRGVQQAADGSLSGSFRLPLTMPGQGRLQAGPYTLALEAIRTAAPSAAPSATPGPGVQVSPLPGGSGTRLLLALSQFTVQAPATWASLGPVRPQLIQPGADLSQSRLTAAPGDPSRLAYCAPGAVKASSDGGATWTTVATTGILSGALSADYTYAQGGEPLTCQGVTLDPRRADSFFVTVQAARKAYGAPPIYYLGFFTTDAGQTWQPVPPPQGLTADRFGGFRAVPQRVLALFNAAQSSGNGTASFSVQKTTDGGRTWNGGSLACPAQGPCVTWGPAPNELGSCAMHGYPQAIERSTDGGKTWQATDWPDGANACNQTQLAALAPQRVALLDGFGDYPLLVSDDAGQTWHALELPVPAGQQGTFDYYRGLQMLSDGTLVFRDEQAHAWQALPAGASAWCSLAQTGLPSMPQPLLSIGGQVWWLAQEQGGPQPQHVPLASLSCPDPRTGAEPAGHWGRSTGTARRASVGAFQHLPHFP